MLRVIAPFAVAGLAGAVLALAGPVVAHAQGTPGGTCPTQGSDPQHTGIGHHSFTDDSDNNCVNFVGTNNTAFLDDSDNNLIQMIGSSNKVDDFRHSDNNLVTFASGSSGNDVNANNADFNTVTFSATATGDFVDLLGISDDTITINGSGVFADIVGSNATCTISSSSTGNGTAGHPGTITC